ncbi:MAG: hypothetical protein BroJett042_32350 [Bacteroidota bacterium]|nr:MAG: hypothetical protein BroJett042_32350 [Bacteroidota bacterium]
MIRLFLTHLFIVWTIGSTIAQKLQSDWITQIGGPASDGIPFHKPDNKGNVFISGSLNLYYEYINKSDGYIDSIKIERYNDLTSTVYLAKLNEFGKVIFYKTIVESGYAETRDMEIDSEGNIYILLTLRGSVNLEGAIVSSNPNGTWEDYPGTLLIKYNQNGEVLWYKNFIGPLEVIPLKLEVNSKDEIITLTDHPFDHNHSSGFVDISGTVHEFNETNTLLTCFNSIGEILWFKDIFYTKPTGIIPQGYRYTADFKIDQSDNIYVYGQFEQGIYFSETDSVYIQYPAVSNFLLKLSTDQSPNWVRQINHPEAPGVLTAIEIFFRDDRIGLVCQNRSSNTIVLNNETLTEYNIGIEFNSEGTIVDVYDFYTEWSGILDVTTDTDGNVYFIGGISSGEHFVYPGYDFFATTGSQFIIKYNGDQIVWADFMGHGGGYRIELDSRGDIFWIGAFGCTADVFGLTFTSPNCFTHKSDILVSRVSSKSIVNSSPTWACPNETVEFKFDVENFVYESSIQEITWEFDDSVSHADTFHYKFYEGGLKKVRLTLQADNGRVYKRYFDIDIKEVLYPVLTIAGGTLFCSEVAMTYKWYRNGDLFSTTSSGRQDIEFEKGEYQAEIVTSSGCSFLSNDLHVVFTATDEVLNPRNINVFPNPFINQLEINSNFTDRSVELKLYDNTGRILNTSFFKDRLSLDLETLPRGIYYLQLNSGERIFIKKVIKI